MRLAPKKAKNQCQKCLLRKAFGLFLKRVSCTCIFVFGCRCARLSFLFSLPSFILIVSSEIRLDNVRNELIRVMSVLAQCTSHLQSLPMKLACGSCAIPCSPRRRRRHRAALAHFKAEEPGGYSYEKLLAVAEDCAEAVVDERGSALLLLVRYVCWSRYRNYHGVLDEDVLEKIADSVRSNFASDKASVVMGSHMLSADHLPEAFRDVRGLLERMRRLNHGEFTTSGP